MVTRATGFAERQLAARLKWLMFGRLVIAVICLCAILAIPPFRSAYSAPYQTLLVACFLNLVYLVVARAGVALRALAVIQVLLDVVLVGVLVYFTGIDRFFAFLYFAVVIAAAMLIGARMALAMASLASVVLAALSTLYFFAGNPEYEMILPQVDPDLIRTHTTRPAFILPYLFFFALSLHVVALLAGRLSQELSRVHILTDEILQNMAGGVLAADHFGGIQFINAQAARLLGIRDPDAVRGRQIDEVLPAAVADLLRQATQTRERLSREVRVGNIPVGIAVSCLAEGKPGPVRGVVAILNDLTLRAQMEEMTRRAERFRALLQMSAGMAHEIRNPLASIRGAAQELDSSPLQGDDRKLLEVVVRESDRLNRIIGDFLAYASDRPLEMSLFDLADLLREVALMLEARQPDAGVGIVREISRAMVCRGAPDKLKQVFLNLGLNALEACEGKDGGRVTLRCLAARGFDGDLREGVLVEIEDNGSGVAPADLQRVFDPFFTTKPQGTGMGLAIARRIVQGHEGEITFESEEGRGTTVKVWLPS